MVASGAPGPWPGALAELRAAVVGARWDRAAELCALVAPSCERQRVLVETARQQIRLHAEEVQVACGQGAAPASPLAWLTRSSLAAIDGRPGEARAALRESVAASTPEPGAAISWPDRDSGMHSGRAGDPRRLIGVVRPSGRDDFTIGEAGSLREIRVVNGSCPAARGTPVEMAGHWNDDKRAFECARIRFLSAVPDYAAACAAVTDLCALAGLPAAPQRRLAPSSAIDPHVLQARARRREREPDLALAAAEILEPALAASRLSLDALARVHAMAVGQAHTSAGQLRITAAVIRWGGVITFRAPPVETARSQARHYLRDLTAELRAPESARHPAVLGAEAVARLTSSHPFADGNGRVARAVASWLLLRAGFRLRGDASPATYLDARLDEHFVTLRNVEVSPWAWHQLFYDAVLTTFTR